MFASDESLAFVAAFLEEGFVFVAGDTFFTAGVLVFLVSATAAEVFLFAAFFAVAVSVALILLGLLVISLLVLDLALSAFLEADFAFFFAIMSPPSNGTIRNTGNLPHVMILMQTPPVNKLQLIFDAGHSRDYV
jgi:hypothetical protein